MAKRQEHGYRESSNNESPTPTPVILPETEVNEQRVAPIKVRLPQMSRARGCTQSQYDLRERLATNMQESKSQPVDGKKKRKMDREEAEKQKETDEGHTEAEQTQPTGSNRCNLQSICRLLKDTELNDQHIASLKKTPFWLLFEAILNRKLLSDNCRKYDEVVLRIIQSYDEQSRSFIVGDRQLKLTKEHVKLIFGISCGEVEMLETNVKKESVALAKRLEIKEPRLSAPAMKQKIKELTSRKKEQHVDDVVRLLCLYLCVTLFFSNKGTTVNWSYVQHMEDLEKVKQYDWAEAIRKYLLMSVHNNHKDLNGLKGSTVLLLYWLCEYTKLIEVKNLNAIPRVVKWKISDLRKSLKDYEQLSQLPHDKVNYTEVQETDEERKIFDEIYGDHGDKQGQASEDHQGEQGGTKVVDDGQTIGVMQQVEVCGEGEGRNDEVQISGDCRGEQGATKLVDDEQEHLEPMIGVVHGRDEVGVCGEEEGEKGGVQVSEDDGGEQVQVSEKVQGLEDFDSPICRPFETEDNLSSMDSGSTLVPDTWGQMLSPNTTASASLDMICETIVEQSKKDATGLIDELKNKIEKLEKEKQNIEIEMIKNQALNEKALQSHKEEIGMLKERNQAVEQQVAELQKMNDNLQNGNKMLLKEKEDLEVKVKDLEAKVEDFEIHQLTQEYPMETEREVHQVTQRATFEKIARLQKEKNDMEDELACVAVHKITQEAAKQKKKLNEQCSPRSMFKRVIARDDRKKNYSEDYVYGQVKRKSPQVNPINVDDSPDCLQQQKGNKKKLKVNTEVDTIDVDKSPEYEQREKGKKKKLKNLKVNSEVAKLIRPETWKKIEQLWKTGEHGTVVMESPQDNIHVELLDIENLLFDDPISNRCVDAYTLLLMRQHIETQPTFDLNTQPPKSYIFISCFMDIIENKKQEQLRRTLHNIMRQAASARFLLFPILTSFHWTLLVLDKENGKWKFYNPLLRRYGRNDEYCIKTKKLRVIIAAYINADKKQADNMLMTETVEIQMDSPQQTTGSVDCGIVVMSIMRKYVENESQTSAMTRHECRQIRANLIDLFLNQEVHMAGVTSV
ncbi:hypothetical protein RHSIM_RhsimUnG0145500 [Rhododendron simsii]|uniref:Ubiquitin-like protease family profile domain-containing protein n=1 Tax=Rhododendron simsii TaxID=118357 RepID=A0A834FXV2_RHOSS|nr:hypothetical protein RHSIM_RhsimUnG0145500 [Rhododendron simsii]